MDAFEDMRTVDRRLSSVARFFVRKDLGLPEPGFLLFFVTIVAPGYFLRLFPPLTGFGSLPVWLPPFFTRHT